MAKTKPSKFCRFVFVIFSTLSFAEGRLLGCRPEDGKFQCLSTSECIDRALVLDLVQDCSDGSDQLYALNCTDNEIQHRFLNRCVHRKNSFVTIQILHLCSEREFFCKRTKKCVDRWRVKNNRIDCGDLINDDSDEEAALPFCFDDEFSCSGSNANNTMQCIPREWVVDGHVDCVDSGLDERMVLSRCFADTEFRCTSGRCIPRYRVLDGFSDCSDSSDERFALQCQEHVEFKCNDTGRCIPRSWRRNKIANCPDGSDEAPLLVGEECTSDEVMCKNEQRCIPKSFLCDGIDQCGDCSDEVESCEAPRMFRCPGDPNGKCIHWEYSCDGVQDCPNRADDITSITGFKCFRNLAGSNQERYCVLPQESLNDGIAQCDDESDICYKNGTFICSYCLNNKTIIASRQLCDGIFDCPDLSDECLCEKAIDGSLVTQALCKNVCYDENNSSCRCLPGEVFCPNESICVQQSQICDGKVNCIPSGYDEKYCNRDLTQKQSSVSDTTFKCAEIPSPVFDFYERLQLHGFLSILRNSENATSCDGVFECPYFEDECSERANCTNRSPVCDEIPLRTTDLRPIGPILERLFGLDQSDIETFEARKCEGIVEFVIGRSICNGIQECFSGLDEKYCPERFKCDAGEASGFSFKPFPQVSIPLSKYCDGISDCLDSSDELNCSNHHYCKSDPTQFATQEQVLDGKDDCEDRSDECPEFYLSGSSLSSHKYLIVSSELEFLLWFMTILALSGNSAVIATTIKYMFSLKGISASKKPTTSELINKLLILNLAVADFLMGIALLIIIIKMNEFSGRYCLEDKAWRTSFTCDCLGVIVVISSEVSVLTLVCLTSYRLHYIIHPFKSLEANVKFLCIWIFLIWSVSFYLAVVPLMRVFSLTMISEMWIESNQLFDNDTVSYDVLKQFTQRLVALNGSHPTDESIYKDWYSLQSFLQSDKTGRSPVPRGFFGYYSASGVCIPRFYDTNNEDQHLNPLTPAIIIFNFFALIYIAIAYVVIYRRTAFSRAVGNSTSERCHKQARLLQRKVTILIATDAICWLPICLMTLISVTGVALPSTAYAVSAILLLPINSSINPLIYTSAFKRLVLAYSLLRKKLSGRSSSKSSSMKNTVDDL